MIHIRRSVSINVTDQQLKLSLLQRCFDAHGSYTHAMDPIEPGRKTTNVKITDCDSRTEHATGSEGPESMLNSPRGADTTCLSRSQLIENYHGLVQSDAIYNPIAYRFLRELGRGHQGVVFLGLRQGARGCNTHHAIKIFDPSIYSCAENYWTDMGRIASQISHFQSVRSPTLVSRDVYEELNGIGYIQMEAIDGVDLLYLLAKQHLKKARARSTDEEWGRFTDVIFRIEEDRMSIQPGVAIYILRQILRGLETLHDHAFVHSDVKPSNIMIDRFGCVKLIDYGRAVHINENTSFLLGTPYYMSPETHRKKQVFSQSDLYSVGILGIEMLCSSQMTRAHDEKELLAWKLKLPERLRDILPQHVQESALLTDLLRGLIQPDPAQRSAPIGAAEKVEQAFGMLHRELVRMGVDADYGRELENYLSKLVDSETKQIEKC